MTEDKIWDKKEISGKRAGYRLVSAKSFVDVVFLYKMLGGSALI